MSLLEAIKAGEAVLLPTDTVYGVAALPGSVGVNRIFQLKERPASQALPWLVANARCLDEYGCNVSAYAHRLAGMLWPGALTLVVKASERAKALGGLKEDGTVALRCPDDTLCLSLLMELGSPVACTSANVHGEPSPHSAIDLDERFLSLPRPTPLQSACAGAAASTIVDCTGCLPVILREGAIDAQTVLDIALLDATLENRTSNSNTREAPMGKVRLSVASDHGGFEQKQQLCAWLEQSGYEVFDRGCEGEESVDYPDYAVLVGKDVASGEADFGILVCGTGIGIGIAANKIKGIRCANVTTPQFAQLAREHNDANVVSLSGRFTSLQTNKEIIETFLNTQHQGGRHSRRVAKIMQLEER